MTALAKPDKISNVAKRARGQMEVFISRGKILLHLAFWAALLFVIAWVFILPYREMAGDVEREFPHRLIELLGDEFFLGIGILICGLILWYMATLIAMMLFNGPLFRISRKGLWLCQANSFFISKTLIRSILLDYRHGFVTGVFLDLNDREVLRELQKRLPKLAGITCNLNRGYLSIELAGLKNKKTFTRALTGLATHMR